ncbi:uncharacterized protein ACN427_004206 isoform 1-T2 [Glossina fuscipes fuscipes]
MSKCLSSLLHDKHFLNSKKSYDSTPKAERKASHRCYDDIEKDDTYNVSQNFSALVPSNLCKPGRMIKKSPYRNKAKYPCKIF